MPLHPIRGGSGGGGGGLLYSIPAGDSPLVSSDFAGPSSNDSSLLVTLPTGLTSMQLAFEYALQYRTNENSGGGFGQGWLAGNQSAYHTIDPGHWYNFQTGSKDANSFFGLAADANAWVVGFAHATGSNRSTVDYYLVYDPDSGGLSVHFVYGANANATYLSRTNIFRLPFLAIYG